MKRLFDFTMALVGLTVLSPLLLLLLLAIYLYDFHNPLYLPIRVGKNRRDFRMVKFRSMVVNADKAGSSSTSKRDPRITPVGHIIRDYKLDEFAQLWNVLMGDMSLVGPRPQVKNHVDECYTNEELNLLNVRPGITDFSSIVFSDEGDILKDSKDVDGDYNRLIRPWKSRLGLLYVEKNNFWLDIQLIFLTIQAIINKPTALNTINKLLIELNTDKSLAEVCKRTKQLYPFPPPGAHEIFNITH
jgi:lipopolysaccharide/colanic/teichoic acid biosynthesis glycosyltransferase